MIGIRTVAEAVGAVEFAAVATRTSAAFLERFLSVPVAAVPPHARSQIPSFTHAKIITNKMPQTIRPNYPTTVGY